MIDRLAGAIRGIHRGDTDKDSSAGAAACTSPADQCGKAVGGNPSVRVSIDVPATAPFGQALNAAIFGGQRITRAGWNVPGQYVQAQFPDLNSKMGSPYLFLKNAQNQLVPWVPSQGDLFAHDWAILPG